ncbi:hypothetical protein T02_13876 [Trichinella nativa]|uniref:Uncharacterized protein n=1 Tax=Trichinella nativa TaxID=6335 RepID=A0A0V1KS82_9BILA|nr:hypothetical protein T02_13876 [Trichinella nativa]
MVGDLDRHIMLKACFDVSDTKDFVPRKRMSIMLGGRSSMLYKSDKMRLGLVICGNNHPPNVVMYSFPKVRNLNV